MWTSELIMWALDLRDRGVVSQSGLGFDAGWGDPSTTNRLMSDIAHRRGFGDILAESIPEAQVRIGRGAESDPIRKGRLIGVAEHSHPELGRWNGFSFGRIVDPRGPVAETAYSSITWIPERTEEQLRRYCDRIGAPSDRVDHAITGGTDGYDLASFTRYIERHNMAIYSIGQCNRPFFSRILDVEALANVLAAGTGLPHTPDSLLEAGDRMITLQRLLNAAFGLDVEDDMGPEREIDVDSADELEAMLGRYYNEHGWDERGIPTETRLSQLGLTGAADLALSETARKRAQIKTSVVSSR